MALKIIDSVIAPESQAVLAALIKEKGDKLITPASKIPALTKTPTGIFEFDLATMGGFPKGRISIIWGPEGSGKSNLALRAVRNVQTTHGANVAVYVDVENALDPLWAGKLGVDLEKMLVARPGYAEELVDMVQALLAAEDVGIMVIDSLAAITGSNEVEKSAEDATMAGASKVIAEMIRKITTTLTTEARRGHFPTVILLNQLRHKVGFVMGNPEYMPGGKAPIFASILNVRVSGTDKIVKDLDPVNPAFKTTSVTLTKHKMAVSRKSFTYDFCLLPHGNLKVGDTDSFNTVQAVLKSFDVLEKLDNNKGWKIFGQTYLTLVPIKDRYTADQDFQLQCQQAVIQNYKDKLYAPTPGITDTVA